MMEEKWEQRGSQSGIFRMGRFSLFGLVHILFYKVLIFVALVTAALIVYSMAYGTPLVLLAAKISIIAAWILFTPQLFSAIEAFSLVRSRGLAFGKYSEYYMKMAGSGRSAGIYAYLPYATSAVWIVLLLAVSYA